MGGGGIREACRGREPSKGAALTVCGGDSPGRLIENRLCMQKGYVLLRETFFPFVFMQSAAPFPRETLINV